SLAIDASVAIEQAEHDARGTSGLDGLDVVRHHVELDVGIAEVAAAGPDDHVDRDRQRSARKGHGPGARRDPAHAQVFAELDTVGTTCLCRQCGIDALNADLDDWMHTIAPVPKPMAATVLHRIRAIGLMRPARGREPKPSNLPRRSTNTL